MTLKQPTNYSDPDLSRIVTIDELRQELAGLPGDYPIFVDGYEGGLDRPYLRSVRLRTLQPYVDSGGGYTGPWKEQEDGEAYGFVLHRQD